MSVYFQFWAYQGKSGRDRVQENAKKRNRIQIHWKRQREKETQRNTHMLENLVSKGTFGGIRLSYGGRANWKEKRPRGGGGLVTKLCPTLVTPWTVACHALCPWDSPFIQARILEWVAISLSRSGWPRDWTWISCIAGRYFTDCARPEVWQGTCGHVCPEQKAIKKRKLKGDGEGTAGDQQGISYEHLPRKVHYHSGETMSSIGPATSRPGFHQVVFLFIFSFPLPRLDLPSPFP